MVYHSGAQVYFEKEIDQTLDELVLRDENLLENLLVRVGLLHSNDPEAMRTYV